MKKIDGVDTYHHKFLIDKNKFKKLIADLDAVVQDNPPLEEEVKEESNGESNSDFDKKFEVAEPIEGEIWIGKKDYLPYKIFLSMKVKEKRKSKTAGQLTIALLFKNYNKPVEIDIPSSVKSIEEIIGQLFGGFSGGMQLPEFQELPKFPKFQKLPEPQEFQNFFEPQEFSESEDFQESPDDLQSDF